MSFSQSKFYGPFEQACLNNTFCRNKIIYQVAWILSYTSDFLKGFYEETTAAFFICEKPDILLNIPL